MPPQETTSLLVQHGDDEANKSNASSLGILPSQFSFGAEEASIGSSSSSSAARTKKILLVLGWMGAFSVVALVVVYRMVLFPSATKLNNKTTTATGPYQLVQRQVGTQFLDHYDFLNGPDSLGSAGYNTYTGRNVAWDTGLVNITREGKEEFIYMKSAVNVKNVTGPRASVRLEGKRRFNRGLFVLDLHHMPHACGAWPAFWLTDEANWPENGEIDILEGVNYLTQAKTALHTSESCSMYGHVSTKFHMTGKWDRASGIPDTWTGVPDVNTSVPADNCWTLAPHQWANQGCVAVNRDTNTLGAPLNQNGGGVFALEWDPANGYIRSWVFSKSAALPANLQDALEDTTTPPDPSTWGLPYGYFAIGEKSGCSSDHFSNMRIVFNLAFCGTVAGNRFFRDCPLQAKKFNNGNPVESCNAYIASNPAELEQAYWKIRGVHVYERSME